MRKKQSINAKVLRDLGLQSPTRFVRKAKPNPYPRPRYADREEDLIEVYEALKKILKRHEKKFVVEENEQEEFSYQLYIPPKDERRKIHFLGINKQSGWVSFHMPALMNEIVVKKVPKKLAERRHAEHVFNFSEIDRELFKMLAKLIADVIGMAEDSGYF